MERDYHGTIRYSSSALTHIKAGLPLVKFLHEQDFASR